MQTEPNHVEKTQISQLHAATCLLMTRFISGHHCPKLAKTIVQQLEQLLAHPDTQQLADSRDMYSQLLQHWHDVFLSLTRQNGHTHSRYLYH